MFFQLMSFTVLPYIEISGIGVYFTAILYLVFPEYFERIDQNGYSKKDKSFFKYTVNEICQRNINSYNSYFSSIVILKKKQIWKGNLIRKSHCIMNRGDEGALSNINDQAQSRYLF